MAFAALRASVRKAALPAPAAARARPALRSSAFRRYSTETPGSTPPPPPKSSNTALFAGVGAAALGGVAFWVYTSQSDAAKTAGTAVKSGVQSAKAAANFVPTKEDYIKVRHLRPPARKPRLTGISVTGLQQDHGGHGRGQR